MGVPAHQSHRLGHLFKKHDEKSISELLDLYKSDGGAKEYIAEAQRRANNIQNILEADKQGKEVSVDQAWDGPPKNYAELDLFDKRN